MGSERNRNTRKSRNHRKKHISMGIISGNSSQKGRTRRTPPPQRRMCIDYRRINQLQPEVTKADGGKVCISLIPLPKIDELYVKLKGYKVLSSLNLR